MTEPIETFDIEMSERDGRVVILAADASGDAMGWAWLEPATRGADNASVYVLPALRGRGVGASLVEALLGEAAPRGVAYLRVTHPDGAAQRQLVQRTHAVCSRRVVDGRARDVVLVPAA
jgi:GNAT superfamily N-acetyltransferase